MKSGDLKHYIEVISGLPDQLPSGHYVQAGKPICGVRAAIRGIRASDSVAQGAQQHSETLEITMRWRPYLDTSMRVKWAGRLYEIERIDPVPFERQYMRIWAHSLRKQGGVSDGTD